MLKGTHTHIKDALENCLHTHSFKGNELQKVSDTNHRIFLVDTEKGSDTWKCRFSTKGQKTVHN